MVVINTFEPEEYLPKNIMNGEITILNIIKYAKKTKCLLIML